MNYVTMRPSICALVSLLTVVLIPHCCGDGDAVNTDTDAYLSRFIADLWLEGADVVRIIWRDCSKKVSPYPIFLFLDPKKIDGVLPSVPERNPPNERK